MYQRVFLAILLAFLGFEAAAAPDTPSAKSYRLNGILISDLSRSALIDGRSVQAGSWIGGSKILAIEQYGIRVRQGGREFIVDVGGTLGNGRPAIDRARVARRSAQDHGSSDIDARLSHKVKSGETLSGIALQYRKEGVTVEQMMIALYQANPHAFSNNINRLRADAVLKIPADNMVHRQSPARAALDVARHADRWRLTDHRPRLADVSDTRQYGPVEAGDTLSSIALRVMPDSVTVDQMMIALYQANPRAFSGNINVLHQGAVLIIPGNHAVRQQTPATARAEVVRQTKAWQAGIERHARSQPEHSNTVVSTNGLQQFIYLN